jgi:hypothetical protein
MRQALFGSPERRSPLANATMSVSQNTDVTLAIYGSSIIQMLDRWVPDERTGMFFKAEAFPDTIDQWNGIPLVFANDHPDLDLFENDPQSALKKVTGRIVGKCSNTRYVQQGHPHILTALEITDQECVDLWQAGKLSLSTAFWATVSGTDVIGDVRPNHVLLFAETAADQPKDKGTLIQLSQRGKTMTTEQMPPVQNEGRALSGVNAPELTSIATQLAAFIKRINGSNSNISADSNVASTDMTFSEVMCVHHSKFRLIYL